MAKTIKYRCPECKGEKGFDEGSVVVCPKSIGDNAKCTGHESMVPVADVVKEEKPAPANA